MVCSSPGSTIGYLSTTQHNTQAHSTIRYLSTAHPELCQYRAFRTTKKKSLGPLNNLRLYCHTRRQIGKSSTTHLVEQASSTRAVGR
eukprot:3686331-Rhodomonas_salina.3